MPLFFYESQGIVFQPNLSLAWCKQPDVGLPKPDMVCFLDVSEEVAMKRADFGGERYELTDMQRRVRENYVHLTDASWVTVSADGTMEEVGDNLYKLVKNIVDKEDKLELGKLWMEKQDDNVDSEMETASTFSQTEDESD